MQLRSMELEFMFKNQWNSMRNNLQIELVDDCADGCDCGGGGPGNWL